MIKTIIIDDEEKSIKTLKNLMQEECPNVEIIATGNSVKSGIEVLKKHQADLVFLDIAMPDGDGFEVLKQIKNKNFDLIFITAFDEYALQAFKFSAFDYLLKPFDAEEIKASIERFEAKKHQAAKQEQYQILQNSLSQQFQKIAISSHSGIIFIDLDEIIRCEANGRLSIFYLENKAQVLGGKNLGQYEKMLQNLLFYRIHDKHLIHLKKVKKVDYSEKSVIMSDDSVVFVSSRKWKDFIKKLTELTGGF